MAGQLQENVIHQTFMELRPEDYFLQQAHFHYDRAEYSRALEYFEKAAQIFRTTTQTKYIDTLNYVLRILAEHENFPRIEKIEQEVLQLLEGSSVDVSVKSRSYYILGVCAYHKNIQHLPQAKIYFRKAIDFAIASQDKAALAYPLYGICNALYAANEYDAAIKDLDSLDILLQCLDLPHLKCSALLLRGQIHRNCERYDRALACLWPAFEHLKEHPNLVLSVLCLYGLGSTHLAKGDKAEGRLYLDLALRSANERELPRSARLVREALASCELSAIAAPGSYELVFDSKTGVLLDQDGQEIRFEGQFILRDLLLLFLRSPGRIFSKEQIAQTIWKQPYDPRQHDNKIYVTIKRLRKLMETQTRSAEYVLRAKEGYFFNQKARVLVV